LVILISAEEAHSVWLMLIFSLVKDVLKIFLIQNLIELVLIIETEHS
jgi:hypothetical protein